MPDKVPRLPIYHEDQDLWSSMAFKGPTKLGSSERRIHGASRLHGHRGLMDALEPWNLVDLKSGKQGIKGSRK